MAASKRVLPETSRLAVCAGSIGKTACVCAAKFSATFGSICASG
ncbi:DUF1804 family protein [Kingella kingae]|nr:DUF1804 family protein [Kingella kingae]